MIQADGEFGAVPLYGSGRALQSLELRALYVQLDKGGVRGQLVYGRRFDRQGACRGDGRAGRPFGRGKAQRGRLAPQPLGYYLDVAEPLPAGQRAQAGRVRRLGLESAAPSVLVLRFPDERQQGVAGVRPAIHEDFPLRERDYAFGEILVLAPDFAQAFRLAQLRVKECGVGPSRQLVPEQGVDRF